MIIDLKDNMGKMYVTFFQSSKLPVSVSTNLCIVHLEPAMFQSSPGRSHST